MFPGEKSSLYRFLLIYIISSLLLFSIGLVIFFTYQKHNIIDNQNALLRLESETLLSELKELHNSSAPELIYPQHKEFQSCLYDIDTNYLFGSFKPKTLHFNREFYQVEDTLFFVQKVYPHYLGAAFIIVKKKMNYEPINTLKYRLILAFVVVMIFITLIAVWLGKLFLSPMRNSLKLLDDFIKDTTHELNTPVSTILNNAELLKDFYPEIGESKELKRIETASKRLSRIYDDLAYIHLNHKRHQNIESLNVSNFLKERVLYFETIANAKRIHFKYNISDNVYLDIDREDMTRIVDNLLSNAFKYTLPNGEVSLELSSNQLSVRDNGIGIDKKSKQNVLKRFVRANRSEGGFGLGLSIVGEITKYYNFTIELESELQKGTKVSILW